MSLSTLPLFNVGYPIITNQIIPQLSTALPNAALYNQSNSTTSGVHEYDNFTNYVYQKVKVSNSGASYDLGNPNGTNPNGTIEINAQISTGWPSSGIPPSKYAISAIYWRSSPSSTWNRFIEPSPNIVANQLVTANNITFSNNYNPISGNGNPNNLVRKIVINKDCYSIIANDADGVFDAPTGSVASFFEFWLELYFVPDNNSSAINAALCSATLSFNNNIGINIPSTNTDQNGSNSNCLERPRGSSVKFLGDNPEFLLANTRSGKIESSFCNNVNVSTTTSTFNTEQYYLVSKNTGGSCTEFSFSTARRTIPNSGYITKYLLASASAYIITGYTPNYLNATTLSALIQNTSTTQIPSQNLNFCSPNMNNTPGNIGALEDYQCISISPGFSIGQNQSILIVWNGYQDITSIDCDKFFLDQHSWRIGYNSCVGTSYAGSFSSPNEWGNIAEVIPPNMTPSPLKGPLGGQVIEGPNLSSIVGNPGDNYTNGPAGVASFFLPTISNPQREFLPHPTSYTGNQRGAYIVRLKMNRPLNLWRGDINNHTHNPTPANSLITASSGSYHSSHLSESIRFYTLTSAAPPLSCPLTIGPSACIPNDPYYDCVSPDRIFYANGTTNTSGQGVNYVSSNGITYATANNMDDDEIVAVFDIQNDCDLLALSGMRVLVDLEPVCNTSTQTYCNPSNASVFLDAGQLEMSVYFSPDVSCDADNSDMVANSIFETLPHPPTSVWTLPTTPTVTPAPNYPENSYRHACGGDEILVQCPGCLISGLYNTGFDVQRITYGYLDGDDNHAADDQDRIEFDQVRFKPIIGSDGSVIPFLNTKKAMYGDLFRMRIKSKVHIFSGQYKPTASELNSALPSNNQIPTNGITSGGAPGFVYGTLRIRELTGKHDYVETFGYTPDPTNTPNITNSIPTVIVWIDDHNTFHSNPYNVGVTGGFTPKPICLFWDSNYDRVDSYPDPQTTNITNEFVFDISYGRISNAYANQYPNQQLPFTVFHDEMDLIYDVTFRVKGNAKDKNIEDSKLEFITKAYFTLVPETQINQRSFRDIQFVAKLPNSTKQIFEDGAALSALPSYYVNNSVILQSNPNCSGQNQNTFCVNCAAALVDPMAAPNAGLFYPNCQLPSSIEFVRWWCVNGGGKFRLVGFEHSFADFRYRVPTDEVPYCKFNINNDPPTNLDDYTRKFRLMNDGSQQSFQREYRNWSNLSSLSFVPLNSPNIPALTPVLASVTQYQIAGSPTPNTYGILNTFVNNQFNVGSAAQQITQQQIPTSSPPPNYYQMDDNEINSFIGVTMGYSDCRKPDMVSYCLRATETDNFTIPFLDNNYNSNVRNGAFIPVTNGFVDPTIGNVSFPLNQPCAQLPPLTTSDTWGLDLPTGTYSAPIISGTAVRQRLEDFDKVGYAGKGHLSISYPPTMNTFSYGVAQWVINVYNQDQLPTSYVGNTPNRWIIIKRPTGWNPGNISIPQGQNSLTLSPVHSFLVSTPNDDFNFDVYYDNLDWLSTDPQAPAGLNQLTINMSYVCPYITSELPEVMVGFSCDIPNDFSAIDDEQTLFNALCDHSGFMLLTTITEGSPILSTSYSLSTQSGGSSMCETSIMELNIANIGNDCLDNTTVSISPGQYTINNLNYSLASNNPLVLTSGQIALSNSTSTSCSNGLFAGNHGVLSLDIGPSCNFNYGSSGQILVTVQGEYLCNGTPSVVSIEHYVNPVLDNPSNVYNEFSISQGPTVCLSPTTAHYVLNLSSLLPVTSTGGNVLFAGNVLILELPNGISSASNFVLHTAQGNFNLNGGSLPLSVSSNADVTGYFGINNPNLLYMPLSGVAPNVPVTGITLEFDLEIGTSCDDMRAGMFTSDEITCNGVICEIFELQNPDNEVLIQIVPTPEITQYPLCGQVGLVFENPFCEYSWATEDGEITSIIASLLPGSYSLTAENSFGTCIEQSITEIIVPSGFETSIIGVTELCLGHTETLIVDVPSGGNYSYEWNDGSTNSTLDVSSDGVFSVIVTNTVDNCQSSSSLTISYIENCCEPQGNPQIQDGSVLSDLIFNGTANLGLTGCTSATIAVEGLFTIDVDGYIFGYCDFNMYPGAQIVIAPGIHVDFSNCYFHTICDEMWQGITVDNSSTLRSESCMYEDAMTAVYVTKDATFISGPDVFNRNYIGVLGVEADDIQINNDRFTCVEDISILGSSQDVLLDQGVCTTTLGTPDPTHIPYAGVMLFQMKNQVNIVESDFEFLSKGIAIYSSPELNVTDTRFADIHNGGYPNHKLTGTEGVALSAHNTIILRQSGFGNQIGDPVSFERCDKAVFVDRPTRTRISFNNMIDIGYGFDCLYARGGSKVYFTSNRLELCAHKGVYIYLSDPKSNLQIQGNYIEMKAQVSPPINIVGIDVQENGAKQFDFILENEIHLVNANTGILLNSAIGAYAGVNRIYINDALPGLQPKPKTGIAVWGCNGAVINCNDIRFTGSLNSPTNLSRGIVSVLSTQSSYTKNELRNLHEGIRFDGPNTHADPRGNIMDGNHFGLHYGTDGLTTDPVSSSTNLGHTRRGNIWLNTPAGYWGAVHDGNDQPWILRSKYMISNPYSITNAEFPTYSTPNASGTQWFDDQPGCTWPNCTGDNNECQPFYGFSGLTGEDEEIALGDLDIPNYEASLNWIMDKELYAKLNENINNLESGSVWESFYEEQSAQSIGGLYAVEREIAVTTTLDSTQAQIYTSAVDLLDSLSLDIRILDSLYSLPNADTASIVAEIQLSKATIEQTTEYIRSMEQSSQAAKEDGLDLVRNENTIIYANELYETNEKMVNDIWMSTIGKNNYSMSQSDIETLSSIAHQCPLAGGKAVFEARALYSKFEDVEYDDQAACALVGITMREMQEREQSEIDFTLDPNPADARVTISSITGTLSGVVSILDINGRTLWTDHLKEAQQKIIPTATFPAGVYCCRIKTTNEQVLIRTFIITH